MRIISKKEIKAPFLGKLGEVIYEMIGSPKNIGGTTNHSVVHVIIPPGKSSEAHYHKISEETYYILSGKGEITIDSKKFLLDKGQACLIMPREVHKIVNNSSVDLEFLTISAPAWNPKDSYFV